MKEAIGPILSLANRLKPRHDDDFVDRLHYVITPSTFITFAIVIACKQYVGDPIQCWAPHEVATKKSWMKFAENYCFVENTYYVSMDEQFPMQPIERERRELHYYQWVFFILMGQALMLIAPKLLWTAFSWKSGIDVHNLIQRSHDLCENGEFEGKQQASRELADQISKGLLHHQRKNLSQEAPNGRGNKMPEYPNYQEKTAPAWYISRHLLMLKMLNILVVVCQLYFLTKFLGNPVDSEDSLSASSVSSPPQDYWGISVIRDLMAGRDWRQSGAFPRVTFCDFDIRQPQSDRPPQRYSIQCVLMVNMINEKFFLIVWFWLGALAIVGILNFSIWFYRVLTLGGAEEFILSQLQMSGLRQIPSGHSIRLFIRRGLCRDGMVVLWLISMNCDPTVTSILVKSLYIHFCHAVQMGALKTSIVNPNFVLPSKVQQRVV